MKKYFFLLFSMFIFGSFVSAQEVNNVSVQFCNDGNDHPTYDYTAMLEPGTQKDICIFAQNRSSGDIVIKYSFPKASFDFLGNQICELGDDFSKFFVENPNRTIVIPGLSGIMLKETINAPLGMSGMSYGCLVYQIAAKSNNGGMLNFIVRKALNLKLFVGGESNIDNALEFIPVSGSIRSMNENIGAEFNEDGDLLLNFLVKNNGNLTQNISLEGKIYNVLGFQREFSIPIKKVVPGATYTMSENIGMIPSYKGLFSVRLTLKGEPVFEFDVSNVDDKYKQPVVLREKGSLFIFSWLYVIIAIIIILLFIKIITPKKKKNVVIPSNTTTNTTITG